MNRCCRVTVLVAVHPEADDAGGITGAAAALGRYWLDVVELPNARKGDADGPPPH